MISIRRRQVRITDGLDYTILFFGGALVFVMLVGDERVKRFMHMITVPLGDKASPKAKRLRAWRARRKEW